MKTYLRPETITVKSETYNILESSNIIYVCDDTCKIYHICRDRAIGMKCLDYKRK